MALRYVALAAALREEREALARRMALEMGKPVREGRSEVDKCAGACEWFAAHAAELLAPRVFIEFDDTVRF